MFTAPCRLTINVRSWSSPAILPSSSVLWLCSGQIWSSVRPGEILSSHREWSKYLLFCQHLVEFGFRLTVPIPGTAAFEISYSVDDPKHFWERLPILHTLMWFVAFTFCSIYLVMFILLLRTCLLSPLFIHSNWFLNFGLVFETCLAAFLSYTPGMSNGLRMYPLA